jgi:hypothetical protein
MFTNIRYILLTALRDLLFTGLLIGVVIATWLSHVLGSLAMVETREMALSFAGGSCRVILVLGMIIFVCFHIRQAFETRELDVFLSRPISRASLVFSYWLGFAYVALLLVLPTLAFIVALGIINVPGFYAWGLTILLENWLMITVALFASFTLRSATSATLISIGIYVLSRMMTFFLMTASSGFSLGMPFIKKFLVMLLNAVSVIVPRLDLFGKTEWTIYGVTHPHELTLVVIQSLIFIPLLLCATILDFRKKEF